MIMLSDALSYRHLQVQISSAQITEFLCDNLPPDTLNSYLPSLLIELYRFIEESNSDSGTEDEQSFCSCYQLDVNGLYEIDCHFALDDDPFHDEFVKFAQYNFRSIISVKLNKQAKALAISIIKKAFSNITDIRCGLLSVPYLPDVRELSNCRQAHNDLIATLSFDEAIKSLCTLLSHESKALRLAALHVLKEKCNIMMATIYETPSESVSTVIADNTVSETMEALLELVARETDPQLMGACADCLGEIGAIDPARFRQRLSLVADRSLASLAKAPPPWDLTEVDYALEILQKHLVPSLKSAGPSQDRSGYAIQKILKRLSILLDATQAAERHQQMPESLCDVLLSRNIYDLVLPFWSTNYNIKDVTTHSTPLFTSTMPYGRWIGLWVRYLNSQVSGKFQSIFEACRGVVRTRSELAQYLLPYLVADVLTYSADRKAAAEDLKNEICLVLSSNEDQTRQGDGDILDDINNTEISSGVSSRSHNTGSESAIQVVFMLLDTLKSWQTTGLMILHSFKAGKKTSTAKRNEKIINLENFLSGMNDLINIIPTTLLVQAAIRVKAFTRAVREIEIHSREFHRKKRLNNSSIAVEMSYKDHANGVLPVLAIEDIETLLDIHAKLDDTDQMQGLLMLSQIFGYPTKISNRILFMEHTHDWVGALVEYGVITASTSYQQVLTSMSHRTKGTSVQNVNQPELRDNQEETLTAETVHQLEKGKLKCWIEMGQLSAAIEQVKFRILYRFRALNKISSSLQFAIWCILLLSVRL